ncbi:hypothetical protein DTW90_00785 [Neorhizobium sp. P12A]|uniref:hypothetical protein n=1 Tax=Neorhizobium sp. P12A TaxID=2268027 RepID=UPI0011ECED1F|nr:hypothetical protein [Neorhizobium sp. P12A]KAA0700267.1 hypothetical protein DTW90_00785 [Neorhizobium sp. P12A]
MTQTQSRSRQQAEVAFAEAQSEFFARGRAVDELDSIAQAREEKTLRLRTLRLAKEEEAQKRATVALISKRKPKI